jgi:hypothetical protein
VVAVEGPPFAKPHDQELEAVGFFDRADQPRSFGLISTPVASVLAIPGGTVVPVLSVKRETTYLSGYKAFDVKDDVSSI